MQTIELGRSGLRSTRLAYGCMRVLRTYDPAKVTEAERTAAVKTILAAYEAGFNHFDTADIYCGGESERALGQALRRCPGMRDEVIVATKCGVRMASSPDGVKTFDFSAAHIERQAEHSLGLLRVECIDLYLLHRPDFLMDPGEVAAAFDRLQAAGKVRHFGVSNMSIPQIDALASACDQPIVCNQIELHPLRIGPFENGELWEHCNRGIAVTAWSPLMGGVFAAGGRAPSGHPQQKRIDAVNAALDDVAGGRGVSRTAIALAWLMRHAAGIIPIVGSSTPSRIVEAAAADDVTLSRQEWYRILRAIQGRELP
jgi:predicted oxidoreductase